jgi:hypothetical protein
MTLSFDPPLPELNRFSWSLFMEPSMSTSEITCTYPLCLPRSGVDAHDLHRYQNDLDSRAADLFAAEETICNVELCEYTPGGSSRPGEITIVPVQASSPQPSSGPSDDGKLSAPFSVSTAKILRSILEVAGPIIVNNPSIGTNPRARERCQMAAPQSCKSNTNPAYSASTSANRKAGDQVLDITIYAHCSTIHRANSWSRMQITSDMFRTLCAASRTTPNIIDLIRGMRYKLASGDEHYMNCFHEIDYRFKSSTKTGNKPSTAPGKNPGFRQYSIIQHWIAVLID